jgi:predicted nuclease with TOPRIM domain
MDEQVVEILKEIRDEAKQTNSRLESLGGHVDALEHRLSEGFQLLTEQIDFVNRRQTETELRLATEVVSLAGYVRELRDTIAIKLDDHVAVLDHEKRIQTLEDHFGSKD